MKKSFLSFALAFTTLFAMAQQIVDVSVYDDCSKNGYTKIIGSSSPSSGTDNGHEYVDLGLSVKWATCNVGATNAEDYGNYYAWGETATKSDYSLNTYKYCNGSETTLTKYCTNSSFGTIDNKTTLELTDDAASVNWGGSWRMPTYAELIELVNNCTWTWTTQNSVNGYKVTATNGNSIFLPAAGGYRGTSVDNDETNGSYRSSSLKEDDPRGAWLVYFYSGTLSWGYSNRYYGDPVRAVHP